MVEVSPPGFWAQTRLSGLGAAGELGHCAHFAVGRRRCFLSVSPFLSPASSVLPVSFVDVAGGPEPLLPAGVQTNILGGGPYRE